MLVYQKTMFDLYYCIKSFCHLKTLEKHFEKFIFVLGLFQKKIPRGGGGEGGEEGNIYFTMGGWYGHFSNYMGHWCLKKSDYMGGGVLLKKIYY